MNVRKTAETDLTVTLEWDPVPAAESFIYTIDGSDRLTDGKRHFTFDGSTTSVKIAKPADDKPHTFSVVALGKLDSGTVTINQPALELDAFRCFLEPGGYEQAGDHLTYAWANFHSTRTPRHSLNGDPDARYIGDGDRFFIIKGIRLVKGWPGRWFNLHNVAGDPGWSGVSSFAIDLAAKPGDSGSQHEVVEEYERVQDTDLDPKSGGAHWPLPVPPVNAWTFYAIDYKAGRAEDGWFRIYDWPTMKPLAAAEGVNTLKDDSSLQQLWEGAYISTGVTTEAVIDHVPALFSTVSFADCLTDVPVLVDSWSASGPSLRSRVQLGIENVTVPPAG